ncbi:MAG TPA: hypothetical protein VH592_17695 [Gemmataceae bacterium]
MSTVLPGPGGLGKRALLNRRAAADISVVAAANRGLRAARGAKRLGSVAGSSPIAVVRPRLLALPAS